MLFTRIEGNLSTLFTSYLIAVELMALTKCYHSILDVSADLFFTFSVFCNAGLLLFTQLTLALIEHCNEADSISSLLGTFDRYLTIWNCMDMMPTIVKALDNVHQAWKHRGIQSRPLLALLIKFDNGRYLAEASRIRVSSDIAAFTLV